MAEEVKKIITIEVGRSITNVRDFKKHIEDLRGALLGLNEESDEYKQIAEQITTDQAKLNDVMAVGKKNTDSAAGSYNELNNQLKALRQQYRALSETERNSSTGQAILQNITRLDTQLKDIDESMGQYQRNVGNYKGAFEEAFKAVSRDIGNINPKLGALMQTASSLIPLIKKATAAATTGLNGVKAAMASTGIGLLVVALGEIIANWEKIHDWVLKVFGKQKELTSEIKNSADKAADLRDRYKEALDYQNRLRRAQGKTDLEIVNEDLKNANDEIRKREELNKTITEYINQVHEIRKDIASSNAFNFGIDAKIGHDIDELTKNISSDLMGLGQDWGKVLEFKRKVENESSVFDLGGYLAEFENFLTEQHKINEGIIDDNTAQLNQLYQDRTVATEAFIHETEQRAKAAANALKSELDQRRAKYEEDKQYTIENIQNVEERNKVLKNLENEYLADVKRINQKAGEAARERLNQEKQQAKELYESLLKYGATELDLLDENYVEQLTLLSKFGYDTTILTKKWQEEREKIVLENYQKEQEELKAQEAEKLRIKQEAFQKELDMQNSGEFLNRSSAETMWTINTKTHETDIDLENQKNDRLFQIAEQGYLDRIDLYNQYLSTLEEGTDEYYNISKTLHEEEMGLAKLQYDYEVELEDRALAKKKQNYQIAQGMIQAYGNLAATIAGVIGDASEEGTARWKAARITETVINTISGAAGAFMQGMSSYPQPWGAIIGAAGAAVATITGAAEIAKLKKVQPGDDNPGSGISAGSSVAVEPLLNPDYDLQRMSNLSLQSDDFLPGNTQVYVLESDIQEVGTRVQVRENNSTF